MKTKVTLFIALFVSFGISLLHAQQIQEETIEYNKESVNAVSVEIPDLDVKTTNCRYGEIHGNQRFAKYKDGVIHAYFNQPFAKIGTENYEYVYYRLIQRKTQKPKDLCLFFACQGNENFVNSETAPSEITNVKTLLIDFAAYSVEFALEQKIMHTKEVIADLEKRP
jgi:hypothetical protein